MAKTVTITSISSIRTEQHPLIRKLADCIEGVWQRYLDLSPYDLPGDLGYVEGRLEGEKLRIENRCYQTPQFRKLHLELAKVGTQLDILHCVMFPNPNYPLPMFGTDLVGGRGKISAAIADLSPTSPTLTLPPPYIQLLKALPEIHFSQPRDLPEWGDIFSDYWIACRPSLDEAQQICNLAVNTLHQYLIDLSTTASSSKIRDIIQAQNRYSLQQRKNEHTTRVILKLLGEQKGQHFIENILFPTI